MATTLIDNDNDNIMYIFAYEADATGKRVLGVFSGERLCRFSSLLTICVVIKLRSKIFTYIILPCNGTTVLVFVI